MPGIICEFLLNCQGCKTKDQNSYFEQVIKLFILLNYVFFAYFTFSSAWRSLRCYLGQPRCCEKLVSFKKPSETSILECCSVPEEEYTSKTTPCCKPSVPSPCQCYKSVSPDCCKPQRCDCYITQSAVCSKQSHCKQYTPLSTTCCKTPVQSCQRYKSVSPNCCEPQRYDWDIPQSGVCSKQSPYKHYTSSATACCKPSCCKQYIAKAVLCSKPSYKDCYTSVENIKIKVNSKPLLSKMMRRRKCCTPLKRRGIRTYPRLIVKRCERCKIPMKKRF